MCHSQLLMNRSKKLKIIRAPRPYDCSCLHRLDLNPRNHRDLWSETPVAKYP